MRVRESESESAVTQFVNQARGKISPNFTSFSLLLFFVSFLSPPEETPYKLKRRNSLDFFNMTLSK